jgi:hypothetical protein
MQKPSCTGAQEIFSYPVSIRRKPFGICSSKNISRTRCKVHAQGVSGTDIALPSVNLNAGWGGRWPEPRPGRFITGKCPGMLQWYNRYFIRCYLHHNSGHLFNDAQKFITNKICRTTYRGADKSLAKPGRKQATAILIFIYPIYNHNWRNISNIYICNKIRIKRNILTIKKIYREAGRAKDLSVLLYLKINSERYRPCLNL